MSEGFSKHFNSTTINGRANVAKATYASIALIYLYFRMRRGGKKKAGSTAELPCDCDKPEQPEQDHPSPIPEPERECSVCRERSSDKPVHEEEGCNGHDEPPTKPPPPPPPPSSSSPPSSGSGSAMPRKRCPCGDANSQVESALKTKTPYQSSSSGGFDQTAPPFGQRPKALDEDSLKTARDLMGQVHSIFFRVLRSAIGTLLGSLPISTDQMSNETEMSTHYWSRSQAEQQEQHHYYEEDQEHNTQEESQYMTSMPNETNTEANATCTPDDCRPPVRQAHSRHRCYIDGFASEMCYDDYDD